MEDEGFRSVHFPAEKAHKFGLQIIIAESDGIIRQKQERSKKQKQLKTENESSSAKMNNQRSATQGTQDARQRMQPMAEDVEVNDQMIIDNIETIIIEKLSQALKIDIDEINVDESFADYGVDSIIGVDLVQSINQSLKTELETTDIFDYTSVNRLVQYILSKYKDMVKSILSTNKKQKNNY